MKRIRRNGSDGEDARVPGTSRRPIRADGGRVDIEKAKRIWDRYCEENDVSQAKGRAAGIDPESGEVWLGDSISDIVERRDSLGLNSPLFFLRVGFPNYCYYCKRGRRQRRLSGIGHWSLNIGH